MRYHVTDSFKAKVIEAIKADWGLVYDTDDFWTSLNTDDGPEWGYDVNVFDNNYCDCADDEFGISVYNLLKDEDGELYADFEGKCGYNFETFYVKKVDLIER